MSDRFRVTCEALEARRLLAAGLQVDPGWFAELPRSAAMRRALAEPRSEWIVQLSDESAAAASKLRRKDVRSI